MTYLGVKSNVLMESHSSNKLSHQIDSLPGSPRLSSLYMKSSLIALCLGYGILMKMTLNVNMKL